MMCADLHEHVLARTFMNTYWHGWGASRQEHGLYKARQGKARQPELWFFLVS